jgi:DNA-binding transcriptional regulator YiaG
MKNINVIQLRDRLGLDRAEFAALIGISSREVLRWEKRQHEPSKLARKIISGIVEEIKK